MRIDHERNCVRQHAGIASKVFLRRVYMKYDEARESIMSLQISPCGGGLLLAAAAAAVLASRRVYIYIRIRGLDFSSTTAGRGGRGFEWHLPVRAPVFAFVRVCVCHPKTRRISRRARVGEFVLERTYNKYKYACTY